MIQMIVFCSRFPIALPRHYRDMTVVIVTIKYGRKVGHSFAFEKMTALLAGIMA